IHTPSLCSSRSLSLLLPPPGSPPFPYTTLFRSRVPALLVRLGQHLDDAGRQQRPVDRDSPRDVPAARRGLLVVVGQQPLHRLERSEEHTSELQSRENLVCRLLLEKKKTQNDNDG